MNRNYPLPHRYIYIYVSLSRNEARQATNNDVKKRSFRIMMFMLWLITTHTKYLLIGFTYLYRCASYNKKIYELLC